MKEIKGSTVRRRYARLPLALALGAMVLTPAVIGVGASTAEASVAGKGETSITLSGDARLRGFAKQDEDFDNARDRQLQHRMRINVDVQAAGGTSLHTRFHMSDRGMDQWGTTNESLNVATDYLYVRVPVGDGTIIAGRQVFNWGHKMKVWDGRGDRITYAHKINDEFTAMAYYHKNIEEGNAASSTDDDDTWYAVAGVYRSGDLTAGAHIRHHENDVVDDNGQQVFGFATYKAGDLTTKFEGEYRFGDLFENAQGDSPFAVFLGFEYAMGDTTLTLGGAYAKNGWQSPAGGHFGHITLAHETSHGSGLGHTRFGASSDDREWAIGIGASHRLSPELTIGGKLAYLDGDSNAANSDWSATAVDAGLAYKINASTTYHIDGIYLKPSVPTGWADDAYWGLSHRFEIRF